MTRNDVSLQDAPQPALAVQALRQASTLKSKNVRIHKRRTSVRLEPAMWHALNEIAVREGCTIHDLCGVIYDTRTQGSSFTSDLRSFMVDYFRSSEASQRVKRAQEMIKTKKESKRMSQR